MKRVGLILAAAAVTTFAGGTQTRPPVSAGEAGVLLRVAFMMGSRGDAPLPVDAQALGDPQAFESWDPTADNPELQDLLGLRQLVELSRATVSMRSGQHAVALSILADRRRYELDVGSVDIQDDVAFLAVTLKEDGRAVSRPRLGLDLGQKGVACARITRGPDEAFVFFVLQLDAVS